MQKLRKRLTETIDFIKAKLKQMPYIGLLTGTGLGESAESMAIDTVIDYKEIPHFPLSTVQTHIGRMLAGDMNGCPVIAMQGRFHLYEGYRPLDVTYPIRVMQQLGVKILILSNASGGLNPGFKAGDIMLITDHINLTGANPLIGPNEDSWGIRFPDMSRAYNPTLITVAERIARADDVRLQKGIYAGLTLAQMPLVFQPCKKSLPRFTATCGCWGSLRLPMFMIRTTRFRLPLKKSLK
jgi:purine-nucleoside phosphorylase